MGRPRSNYICPKCGNQGYKEKSASRNGNYPNSKYRKYWRVVHYDSFTKKKSFCYVDHIIWGLENKEQGEIKPVNIYDLIRRLEQLSETELQNYALEIEQKHKHMRNNMKAEKRIMNKISKT